MHFLLPTRSAIASPTRHVRRSGAAPGTISLPTPQSSSTGPAAPTSKLSTRDSPTYSITSPTHSSSPPFDPSSPHSSDSPNTSSNPTRQSSLDSNPTSHTSFPPQPSSPASPKSVFYPSSATSLAPYTTLVYHTITPHLALLALLPTTVWESRKGLVEYNVVFFREGVQEICAVERDARRKRTPAAPASDRRTV